MKKKIKYLILMFIMLFLSPFSNAEASTYKAQFEEMKEWIPNDYVNKTKNGITSYQQMYFITRKSDNQFVYCIEPGMELNQSKTYNGYDYDQAFIANITDSQWERIQLLAYYGYGYSDNEVNHNSVKWYTITQFMIWQTIPNGQDIYFTDTLNGNRITKYKSEMAEMEELLKKHSIEPNFGSNKYDMIIGSTLKLTDNNSVLSEYSVIGNSSISAEKSGNDLCLKANTIGVTNVTMKKIDTKYSHSAIVYIDPNSQDIMQVGSYDPINLSIKINITGGKIKLTKVDNETNTTISQGQATLVGAIYNVYDSNNNIVSKLTIGSDKTATTDYLPLGTYTIKEESSSVGYYLDDTIYTANISKSETINVKVKEKVIKGKIKITKVDSDTNLCKAQGEATLVGAKYGVYDYNDKLVDTLTIGNDCTATSKLLPYGKYKIKEEKSSKGYYIDTKIYDANIVNSDTINIISKEKVIKNDFKFYKFYGNVDTGFIFSEPNANFKVLNNKDEVVLTFTTDKNGYAKVTLPYGNYQVYQVKGMDDYKLMFPFAIKVNEDTSLTQISHLKNGSITAKLKLVKIDSETKMPIKLSGVKFKIKNKKTNDYICQTTNKVICEFETNEDGVMITPLPLFGGDYIVEEIKAPNGYLLSDEPIEFSIKEDSKIIEDSIYGSLVEIKFENEAVKGKIEINKTGEKVIIKDNTFKYETIKLEGAVFEVRASEDIIINSHKYYSKDELVGTLTSDELGYASIDNLPLGKYYIKEISSSNNNMIDPNIYNVELKYKDEYTSIVSANKKIKNYLPKGNLVFTKSDLIDGDVIPNTIIEVYTIDNECIFVGATDKNGQIIINELPVGKYYILEKQPAIGYINSEEKVYFEIKEDKSIVKAEMKNKPITGSLEFTKISFSDSEPLPNTLIEIYTESDKLVFSGRTNSDGKIIINNLTYGKYYILEKEAPEGFLINEEKMWFEIKSDGIIVKAIMKDEKIKVPNTGVQDNKVIDVIGIVFIISGLGYIIYEKRKNK